MCFFAHPQRFWGWLTEREDQTNRVKETIRRTAAPMRQRLFFAALLALMASPAGTQLAGLATAQQRGSLDPKPMPPLVNPADPATPAKQLFGRVAEPAPPPTKSVGFYSRGCLAGASALPQDGATWQVMRLSRNRNWGHTNLISFVERLAAKVPEVTGWRGILVGDMSQPRGGPMLTGHASHQIGLDADIWLTPMPERVLTRQEREDLSATNMVRDDWLDVDAAQWTPAHAALIKTAAEDAAVERVLVNPAIKRALCRSATGDRGWLNKVRPNFGHNYHMHVRLACPKGNETCREQDATPAGDGCDSSLEWWFSDEVLHPKPRPPKPPKPPLTLAQLPTECRQVLFSK